MHVYLHLRVNVILRYIKLNKNTSFSVTSHLLLQSRSAWHFSDARWALPLRPLQSVLCSWNKAMMYLQRVGTMSLKAETEVNSGGSISLLHPFSVLLTGCYSLAWTWSLLFAFFNSSILYFALQTYWFARCCDVPYSGQHDLKESEYVESERRWTEAWWQQCPRVQQGRPHGVVTERVELNGNAMECKKTSGRWVLVHIWCNWRHSNE